MASNFVIILFFLFLLHLFFSSSSSSHVQDLDSNRFGDNSSAIDVRSFLHNKTEFSALVLTPTYDSLCGRAGYITLSNKRARMFYFFFESRNGPDQPVVIWLNGGPGVSSSVGLFYENGPLHINPDLSLVKNNYGWDRVSNILYIDQPIGTGFSYSDGQIPYERREIAEDLYNFLQEFFQIPSYHYYAQCRFFIAGQSYAAHYASALAMKIQQVKQSQIPQLIQINLVGIAVGNPFTDLEIQIPTIPEFAYRNGFITKGEYLRINETTVSTCLRSIKACHVGIQYAGTTVDHLCVTAYNDCDMVIEQTITAFVDPNTNPSDIRDARGRVLHPRGRVYYDYSSVQTLLNSLHPIFFRLGLDVNHNFQTFNEDVFNFMKSDWAKTSQDDIASLLGSGIKYLSYTGDYDLLWNYLGTYKAATDLLDSEAQQHFISAPFGDLLVNYTKIVGRVKKYGLLTYVRIHNAGNSVSRDQPEAALCMMHGWMIGTI